jgi:general secretion pathway protein F
VPAFAYEAVAVDGKRLTGSVEAADRLAAASILQQRGLVPLKVGVGGRSASVPWWGRVIRRPQGMARHRLVFARTMCSLLTAGVPLDRSLAVSSELTESPAFRQVLQEVLRAVKGGKSMSAAMENYPQIFPDFYASMANAGEASGNLAAVFSELADYQESANELRGQVTSALIYPALLVVVGTASILILMWFVIPKFAAVFADAGATLPLPTRILLDLSDFLRTTWWAWLIGLPIVGVALQRYVNTKQGRRRWDYFILRVPKVGAVVERVLVARFARSWGTLLKGGVPMMRSLQIAHNVVGNEKLADAVEKAAQGVKQGKGVMRSLEETHAFPPLSMHLIGVGEETGRLDEMLLQVTQVYEREARSSIRTLVALFEPLMILLMGIVVGGIVISLLLAIFSINDIPM